MNDEQIIDLLRAANPVPHHRDAIRVVRETDPLWQSIQVLLREVDERDDVLPFPQHPGRDPMSEDDTATFARRPQRWLAAAAAIAVLVVVVGAVVALQQRPTQVTGIPGDLELPGTVLSPQEAARILDIDAYATLNPDAGPGLAPGDCTSLGVVETVSDVGYLATTTDRGLWGTRVFEFSSPDEARAMIQTIEDDIQDCDRTEHPLFTHDLVSIEDVDEAETAFVMTTEDQDERECWVFVQDGERIATTLVTSGYYGDGRVCVELAGAWAAVLRDS